MPYSHNLLELLFLVIGFAMLVKGADWFVDGAAGIAAKMGIPQLVIGLTIVAMGTSAPEAAVSLSAAFKGAADITIGNTPYRLAHHTLRLKIHTSMEMIATKFSKTPAQIERKIKRGNKKTLLLLCKAHKSIQTKREY